MRGWVVDTLRFLGSQLRGASLLLLSFLFRKFFDIDKTDDRRKLRVSEKLAYVAISTILFSFTVRGTTMRTKYYVFFLFSF